MAFKLIDSPPSKVKTGTPLLKIGDKYVVAGVGGPSVPQVYERAHAGYLTWTEGKLQFFDKEQQKMYPVSQLKIVDTGVAQPDYTQIATADATATADDILQGKIAYGANGKLFGTYVPSAQNIFYKCSQVLPATQGTPKGKNLTLYMERVSDSSPDIQQHLLVLEDATKTGDERTWLSDEGSIRLKKENGVWVLQAAFISSTVYQSEGSYADPWQVTAFMSSPDKAYTYNNTWTVSEGTAGRQASWSGYKATLSDAGYTFADTATTGLSYSYIAPQVGKIYTEDALVVVGSMYTGFPMEGLVFHVPLSEQATSAETEQILTYNNASGLTFGTYKGIQSVRFTGNSTIQATLSNKVSGAMTVSVWAVPQSSNGNALVSWAGGDAMVWASSMKYRIYPPDSEIGDAVSGGWSHVVWKINADNTSAVYLNGAKTKDYTVTSKDISLITIGYRNSSQGYWRGYLAGLRIYNRALTDAQIGALATEYTPVNE